MKKLIIFFSLIISSFIVHAQAGSGYEKAVIDFMEVTNAKETTTTALVSMYQNMNLPVSNMQGLCDEIVETMWPKMINGYTKIMQEYYTLDELKEIIAFYRTPAGKKFAKYNPEIVQKAMDFSMSAEMVGQIETIIRNYVNK